LLAAPGGEAFGKPDVLFIAIDDMNDWLKLFDADNPIKTPNLERLAKRGMFFRRAYCVSPACNPSRAAILTGLRPSTSGVYGNHDAWRKLVPEAVTLPRYFRQFGYATRGAGKIFHHGEAGADHPGRPSFEKFFDMLPARAPEHNYNGYRTGNLSKVWFDWGEHTQKMIDLDTVEWVEKAMEQRTDKPLFLAAGIFKPHLPFYAPPEVFRGYPFIYENTTRQPIGSPGSLKKMVQCYQASADFADRMVGRLLDKLDAVGRADRTIIVLWSDHGYHLGDKKSCVKFTLWEKANHVPFIIVAPGVAEPGSVCDATVSLLDIYPTLVDLCGLPASKQAEGRSLVPLLKDPKAAWEWPAVMTMGRGNHAVRSDRWRYIRYSDGSEELYDHNSDPWELRNVAKEARYTTIIEKHKQWLPEKEVPWKIDETKNWIYRRVEWNDVPRNEKK